MTPNWDDLKPAPQAAPNWDDLKPADHGLGDLREKAIAALPESMQDVARKALSGVAPSWTHNPESYSPYKPAQPGSMPNDAINPVGTDAQMVGATAAAGAGSVGARMLARASEGVPPGPIPPGAVPKVDMSQMPTQQATQMARNIGGAPSMPINAPALPAGAASPAVAPTQAARGGLLGRLGTIAAGGGAHTAAGYLPHPYNDMAHFGLRTLGL